jgi:competence protein ComEC
LDRVSEAIASLALAAIVLCLVLPGSTADVGFQLSFASVFAIVLGMRRFTAWLKMRRRRGRLPGELDAPAWKFAERPLDYAAVSFWATLGTAPLTAFHFNQIALVGLVANAVVVPIMGFGATILGLLGALLGLLWEPAGAWLLWLGSFALRASNWLAAWFVEWPAAWAHMFTPTILEMALAYLMLLVWLTAPRARVETPSDERLALQALGRSFGWRTVAATALTMLVVIDVTYWFYNRFMDPHLRVAFLSVGQGDAAVVRFPGSKVMIIDAGEAHHGYDDGERVIAPYLWSQKILHVDYLVLSHPDADHFGGFAYIASNFSPAEFWAPGIASSDESYATMLVAMMEAHVKFVTITASENSVYIGSVEVHTFAENQAATNSKHNNGSALLRLGFGRVGFLFTGDIEAAAESEFAEQGVNVRATVLKVPHHGSKSSSTAAFIDAVHPAVAVISDGYQNRFHFPAPQVVERYRDAGVKVLRTDLDGAVMTAATPEKVDVRTFRGEGLSIAP